MKNTIFSAVSILLFNGIFYSQVGINTASPKTTMDVSVQRDSLGNIINNAQLIGLQAPRLTRGELTANTATYGVEQNGAMIYITDISNGDTAASRANINSVGYYYFDGTLWQKIGGGIVNVYNSNGSLSSNRTVAMDDKTLSFTSSATSGFNHFNVDGNTFSVNTLTHRVGIGTTDAPSENLDVNGNARIRNLSQGDNLSNYPRAVVAKVDGTLGYVNQAVTLNKQVYVADVADQTKTVVLGKFEFRLRDLGNGTSAPQFRLTTNPGGNISVFYHISEQWNNNNNNLNSGNGFSRFITLEKQITIASWNTWTDFNGTANGISNAARSMNEFSATNISIQYANDPTVYSVDFKIIDIPNNPETYSILAQQY